MGVRAGPYLASNRSQVRTGTNWKTFILPFLEENTLYDQLDLDFKRAMFTMVWEEGDSNEEFKNKVVPAYNCPSSPFDPLSDDDLGSSEPEGAQKHDYVGIAGTFRDPANRLDVCGRPNYGPICRNGVLLVNESRGIKTITDGTSNAIIVSEQSGIIAALDYDGVMGEHPIRNSCGGGWGGASHESTVENFNAGLYHHGLTTVRWALNAPTAVIGSSDRAFMNNTVLNSSHPGIVQVGMADGSVQTLNDEMEMAALRQLCSADDGLVDDSP
jgi:hypothetical protein